MQVIDAADHLAGCGPEMLGVYHDSTDDDVERAAGAAALEGLENGKAITGLVPYLTGVRDQLAAEAQEEAA